jgi:hypothetical protein
MDTSQDQVDLAEGDVAGDLGQAGSPGASGQTPEAQARAFFRDGGDVVYTQPSRFGGGRRRWILAGIVVLLVVAGSISAAVLRPTKGAARTHKSTAATTTTKAKTYPEIARSDVAVRVLNASDSNELARQIGARLRQIGFSVSATGDAPAVILSGNPSEIFYGSAGLSAAHTLGDSLKGSLDYVASSSLAGNNVTLWIANPQLTVSSKSHKAG